MILHKIISGGQTGADQGGLAAGEALGLETGGLMPKDFRTDDGPNPRLAERYGLRQHVSPSYGGRTLWNVVNSDGTLIFGNTGSPGSALTIRLCIQKGKPYFMWTWRQGRSTADTAIGHLADWLVANNIGVLNVAGNRESRNPGIAEAVKDFIVRAVNKMRAEELKYEELEAKLDQAEADEIVDKMVEDGEYD